MYFKYKYRFYLAYIFEYYLTKTIFKYKQYFIYIFKHFIFKLYNTYCIIKYYTPQDYFIFNLPISFEEKKMQIKK